MNSYFNGSMWRWFGLSYSSYLVIPRTLLCGLPEELQDEFVALLEKVSDVYDYSEIRDNYTVRVRGINGKFQSDPLGDYRHPRELPYKQEVTND